MPITITASLSPLQHDTVTLFYQDRYKQERGVSLPISTTATQAAIEALVTAAENVSVAKVCHVRWSGGDFDVAGGKAAATVGSFDGVSEYATIILSADANCKDMFTTLIPAPLEAILTGTEKRLVDGTNVAVIAFVAAVKVLFFNPKDGSAGSGYSFDHGTRGNSRLVKATVF